MMIDHAHRRVRRRSGPDLRTDEAWGRCAIETYALLKAAGEDATGWYPIRVTGQHFPGREHWALVEFDAVDDPADAQVIDLTARQFDPAAAVPWTGTLVGWYDAVLDWLGDWVNVEVYEHMAEPDPFWRDAYEREDVDPLGTTGDPAYDALAVEAHGIVTRLAAT